MAAFLQAQIRRSATCCCVHWRQVEWNGEVQQLSWSPRLFLYKRFLSEAECDHLMNKVKNGITRCCVSAGRIAHVAFRLDLLCLVHLTASNHLPKLHLPCPARLQARPHLEKSEVVDNDTGGSKSDEVRTSSGAFFDNAEDPVRSNQTPLRITPNHVHAVVVPTTAFDNGASDSVIAVLNVA